MPTSAAASPSRARDGCACSFSAAADRWARSCVRLALAENIEVVAPERSALDLTDPPALTRLIAAEPWSVVINAAAYTDVDGAEREEALAFAVNAEAPAHLAAETARDGIPLIHISTDYVFDGKKGAPYVETDPTGPINAYGRSKLAGERGVSTGNPRHVILRTSWVYSPYGQNFVKTILRLAGRARAPYRRRRSARLPDRSARYRACLPRHRDALRNGA